MTAQPATPLAPASESETLSLAEAADVLNIAQPHLTQLLNVGALPSVGEGDERLIRRDALFAYKELRDQRRKFLDEMRRADLEDGLDKLDYRALFPEWFSDPE